MENDKVVVYTLHYNGCESFTTEEPSQYKDELEIICDDWKENDGEEIDPKGYHFMLDCIKDKNPGTIISVKYQDGLDIAISKRLMDKKEFDSLPEWDGCY